MKHREKERKRQERLNKSVEEEEAVKHHEKDRKIQERLNKSVEEQEAVKHHEKQRQNTGKAPILNHQ